MSILSESERLERAIRSIVKKIIEEETRDCFRVSKAVVSTAPDGSVCGVKYVGDDTEMFLPYTTTVAGVSVGDCVLVATVYGSLRNAVVWQTSPMS